MLKYTLWKFVNRGLQRTKKYTSFVCVASHSKTVSPLCRYILSVVNSAGTHRLDSFYCEMIAIPYWWTDIWVYLRKMSHAELERYFTVNSVVTLRCAVLSLHLNTSCLLRNSNLRERLIQVP